MNRAPASDGNSNRAPAGDGNSTNETRYATPKIFVVGSAGAILRSEADLESEKLYSFAAETELVADREVLDDTRVRVHVRVPRVGWVTKRFLAEAAEAAPPARRAAAAPPVVDADAPPARCAGLPGHSTTTDDDDCDGPGPFPSIDALERRRRRGFPALPAAQDWWLVARAGCAVLDAPRGGRLVGFLRRGAAVAGDGAATVDGATWARVAAGDAAHWFYGCGPRRELPYTGDAWILADSNLNFGFGLDRAAEVRLRRADAAEAAALDAAIALRYHPNARSHAADLLPFAPRDEDAGDRFGFAPLKKEWRVRLARDVLGWPSHDRAGYGADGRAPKNAPAKRAWLVPTEDDAALDLAARRRDFTLGGWRPLTCAAATVAELADKVRLRARGARLGLAASFPATYATLEDVAYPCCVKKAAGAYGSTVRHATGAEGLAAAMKDLDLDEKTLGRDWLVEELVTGRVEHSTTLLVFFGGFRDVVHTTYAYGEDVYIWPRVAEDQERRRTDSVLPPRHMRDFSRLLHDFSGICNARSSRVRRASPFRPRPSPPRRSTTRFEPTAGPRSSKSMCASARTSPARSSPRGSGCSWSASAPPAAGRAPRSRRGCPRRSTPWATCGQNAAGEAGGEAEADQGHARKFTDYAARGSSGSSRP